MHPHEKTLAKRLAANSDGKYTVQQVEEQMRGMSMTKDGQTEAGSPDTIIGTNLGDGTWMRVGTTAEGEPIFTQQIAPDDAALRAYIVGNTTNNVVPSLITYAGNSEYTAPVTRNILPIPTAHCGAAAADCAAGIAPPRTQAERDAQRNQGADLASDISTQAGRFAAAATAYGTYLASQPNAAAQGAAAIQFGMAWTATIAGFGAAAFEQALRPDFGQSTIDMSTSIFGDLLGKTAPIASPITNEIIEKIKNTQEVINWRDKLNGKS